MITEVLPEEAVKTDTDLGWAIILHNDDYNTFDHVIDCLIKYCKHSVEQATQCAFIVHNNGKTDVKRGSVDVLKPIYEALLDNHLSATIEPL
jgi:ATP-dependent Clp protease adaptor protein ClpS